MERLNYERKESLNNSKIIAKKEKYLIDPDSTLLFDYSICKSSIWSQHGLLNIGDNQIRVSDYQTIVSPEQINTLIFMLEYISKKQIDDSIRFMSLVDELSELFNNSQSIVYYSGNGFLMKPFEYDYYRVLNRNPILRKYILIDDNSTYK